jgi:hypothetical protein
MSTTVKGRLGVGALSAGRPSHKRLPVDAKEIAGTALAVAAVCFVIFYFFSALRPIHDRLQAARDRLDSQQKVLIGGGGQTSSGPSPKDQIKAAKLSLDEFQGRWLKPMTEGRVAAINQLNEMVAADKLRLASGIEMRMSKKGANTTDPSRKRKDDTTLEAFPKVDLRLTVLGNYNDIRKFIRDVQASKQFLVVNTMGLGIDMRAQRGGKRVGAVQSGPSAISLTLTISAYFRPV